ncbi:MAG: AraC family transcriptional regulator [Sphingomonadaceae bacterium]|nr:AraC family transcriptional regulator [Sphingomonadaceae bacterium]
MTISASPAAIFIEPPGILEAAPAAIQRVFSAMRIRSRDPKLPFRSRMSLIGDVVFSRVEAGGHVDLEWVDHDPAVRNSYRWLIFSSSGGAQSDTKLPLLATREMALYDGASLPDELHLSGTTRNLIVMLPANMVGDDFPLGIPVAVDIGSGAVLAAMARTMEAQAYSGMSAGLDAMIPIFVEALKQTLSQQKSAQKANIRQDARLTRILDHMELHLDDLALDAASAARACGVSLRQLHRLFASTGETFNAMTRRLRLERAVALLADRNMKIGAIAGECGFSDASYFSTVFVQSYGETPSERRRRLLGERNG